ASRCSVPARAVRLAARPTASYRGAGQSQPADAEQQGEAHDGKYDRERDGAIRVALEGDVDGGGHGLGASLEVAGDGDGGAELTEGAGAAEHHAVGEGGTDQRQGDRAEDVPRPGAQRPGDLLDAAIDAAQPGGDRVDVEGPGNEALREH